MGHQSTRVNIARPFSDTPNVFVETVHCLNIEFCVAVVAAGAQFLFLSIVLFLRLCTVWLGSMLIGDVLTSCI
jgi:hypothetical protein